MNEHTKNSKKKNYISIIIVALFVVLASVAMFVVYFTYFDAHKNDKGHASIELSTSVDRIYLGGSGEISAILRYSGDGSTATGNFSFESDRPDLVSFEQQGGKSTGKYAIESKQGNESFDDVIVNVTVSCVDNDDIEPNSIQLTVTDAKPLLIRFYKNREGAESTQINIYQGYSIDQINEIQQTSLDVPDFRPSDDYDTEWYEQDTNEPVSINKSTVFYGDGELKVYGRYRLNKPLKLINELNDDENSREFQTQLYFGESIGDETLLQTLRESLDSTDDWKFEGWVPDIDDIESENNFKADLSKGIFGALNSTLYAKWSGVATLNLTQIIHNDDNEGIVSREGTVGLLSASALVNVPVVYHGVINLAPSQIPTYPEGGTFGGWYTGLYGAGEKITNEQGVGIYNSKSLQLYDKIVFTVNIDYNSATGNYDEEHNEFTAIYGAVVDLVGNGLGRNPTKTGWDFNGWQVVYGSDAFDAAENMPYTLLGNIKIKAQWKWEFKLNTTIVDYSLEQNTVTIFYGKELSIQPLNDWGSWTFEGWYTQRAGSGKLIEQTADYENTSDKNLYAKWVLHNLTLYNVTPKLKEIEDFENDVSIVYGKTIESSCGQSLPSPDCPDGYSNGLGWFNGLDDDAEQITNSQIVFPKIMDVLYYKWTPRTYTVTFDHNGGSNGYPGSITATTGQKLPDLTEYVPSKYSYTFLGYYYSTEDNLYYSADMTGCQEWDVSDSDSVRLIALWGNPCEVTLDPVIPLDPNYDDKEGSGSVKVRFDDSMPSGYIAPQRAGYTFVGFYEKENGQGKKYYDESMRSVDAWDQDVDSATIYAYWKFNCIKTSATPASLTMENSGTTGTTTISGQNGSGKYRFDVISTKHPNLSTVNVDSDSGLLTLITSSNENNQGTVEVRVTDLRTKKTANCEIEYHTTKKSNSCVAAGTLVTLADGQTKKIENVSVGDTILTFDHSTGMFTYSKVLYNVLYGSDEVAIVTMYFSNDITVQFVNAGHGIYDVTLNQYVLINADNVSAYLGHKFLSSAMVNGEYSAEVVEMYKYEISYEAIDRYDIVTENTINCVLNGLITCSDALVGVCNTFNFSRDFTYDLEQMAQDIAMYGLYTYEEWSMYLTYEDFIAVNGAYFKIAVGKGLITEKEIFELLEFLNVSRMN